MTEAIEIPDENTPLERMIRERLTSMNHTLGLAESCTGGRIADRLTDIPGASGYLRGCIVCYHEDVKKELLHVAPETIRDRHVVSEPVAVEMAAGVKRALKADYGFGITGLLGPDDDDGIRAGTVCIAITDGQKTDSVTCHFLHDRQGNKEEAARAGMWMIWKFINKKT